MVGSCTTLLLLLVLLDGLFFASELQPVRFGRSRVGQQKRRFFWLSGLALAASMTNSGLAHMQQIAPTRKLNESLFDVGSEISIHEGLVFLV